MEIIVENSEKEKVPVTEELAEEARKWSEPPPQVVEPRQHKLAPERARSVRYDLD